MRVNINSALSINPCCEKKDRTNLKILSVTCVFVALWYLYLIQKFASFRLTLFTNIFYKFCRATMLNKNGENKTA